MELNNAKIKNVKKNKLLRFDYLRDIIIIPTKEEYISYEIWWREIDYIEFRNSAIKEVCHLVKKYGNLTLHKALLILYNYDCKNTNIILR